MKSLATTLALIMLLTGFGPMSQAEAGLFSKIKDTVKRNPVASLVGGAAVAGGAIIAAPYIAGALGFGSGVAIAGGAGVAGAAAAAGTGLLGVGSAIWGGLTAAGGFVTGALGAIGAGIGSIFSGIAGFIGGIIGSPLLIPALVVIGVAVAGYFLWKKYKRQRTDVGNGSDLPATSDVAVPTSTEISVSGNSTPQAPAVVVSQEVVPAANTTPQTPEPAVSQETTPVVTGQSDALKSAHSEYIKAYNKYISLVSNIGGSENPDEELRTNMRRSDAQTALNNYRESYNKYITLLRESNQK
jgi:hypothetical protein